MALKDQVNLPSYYSDPYYGKTQEELFPFYSNLLKGDIPDYYKGIGEWGGSELEKIIGMGERDITKSISEDFVRRKVSGGLGADVIAKSVGDLGTKLRWDDYIRAISGRKDLLNIGTSGLEGVRSAGITEGGMRNRFNLDIAGMEMEIGKFDVTREDQQKAYEDAMWKEMIGDIISLGGNIGLRAYSGTQSPSLGSASSGGGGGAQGVSSSPKLTWGEFKNYL